MLPKILEDNLSIPVVGAPLFIISRPDLVIAQCKAGVVGSFPALNARPQELLSDWIKQIKDELGQFKEDNPVSMIGALFMTLQKPLFLWVYLIHLNLN